MATEPPELLHVGSNSGENRDGIPIRLLDGYSKKQLVQDPPDVLLGLGIGFASTKIERCQGPETGNLIPAKKRQPAFADRLFKTKKGDEP